MGGWLERWRGETGLPLWWFIHRDNAETNSHISPGAVCACVSGLPFIAVVPTLIQMHINTAVHRSRNAHNSLVSEYTLPLWRFSFLLTEQMPALLWLCCCRIFIRGLPPALFLPCMVLSLLFLLILSSLSSSYITGCSRRTWRAWRGQKLVTKKWIVATISIYGLHITCNVSRSDYNIPLMILQRQPAH